MPNGPQGGFLQQAAQAAAQIPPPGGAGAAPPGAAPPGAAPPGAVPPGAAPGGPPGAAGPAPVTPEDQGAAMPGAESAQVAGGAPTEEASAGEQQEYDRAMGAVNKVLYQDDETNRAIMDQINPNDKISSVVKATLTVINQLDERIDMDEVVIPEITMEIADSIMEMAEVRYNLQFTDRDAQAVAGATMEGLMEMYGVDEQDYASFTAGMSPEQLQSAQQMHDQFLNAPGEGAAAPAGPAPAGPPAGAPAGVPPAGPAPGAVPPGGPV